MGLIEKAFDNDDGPKKGSDQKSNPRGEASNTMERYHAVHTKEPRGNHTKKQFDLDFSSLASQGFFVPNETPTQLSLELRVLKRRLLRRVGFLRNNAAAMDLRLRNNARERNLVMVTSTRPAEGKTFTAINLALSLAIEDQINVTLLDGDAPRPKIQSHLGLRESTGFTDLIVNEDVSFEDVAVRARQVPFTLLPEGGAVDRPGDLFGTVHAQKALNDLSMRHSGGLVIIDAPPVLATTEAIVLAPFVDEILFVVEADSTPEQAITTALEELLDVNPNISLVLNKCLIGAGGSHYGSYSDYYPTGTRRAVSSGMTAQEKQMTGKRD